METMSFGYPPGSCAQLFFCEIVCRVLRDLVRACLLLTLFVLPCYSQAANKDHASEQDILDDSNPADQLLPNEFIEALFRMAIKPCMSDHMPISVAFRTFIEMEVQ